MRGLCQAPFQQLLRRQRGHIRAAFMKHSAELARAEKLQHLQSNRQELKKQMYAIHVILQSFGTASKAFQSLQSSIPG